MVNTGLFTALLAGAGASVVAAAPLEARDSCTFTSAAAVAKGKGSCSTITIGDMTVPAGTTLDLTKLNKNTKVVFAGKVGFGYKEWKGPLISVSGTGIQVSGAAGHVIDGNGSKWWDGKGTNGGKDKPKFFYAHSMKQSSITGLNVKNTPVQGFSINGADDLTVSGVKIDNTAGDKTNGGHNTDAFDIGSSNNIKIDKVDIKNQDDCLAINSGTNIHFTNSKCSGGHGISIGSVGGRKDNKVDGVTITGNTISNSQNGVRIKTIEGATGQVSNVNYSDITLENITKYGIVIQQDYHNGSPSGKPSTGVPITGLTVSNVHGSVASSGTNVYLLCGSGSCKDWKFSNVKVTGGKKTKKCSGIPSGSGAACS